MWEESSAPSDERTKLYSFAAILVLCALHIGLEGFPHTSSMQLTGISRFYFTFQT